MASTPRPSLLPSFPPLRRRRGVGTWVALAVLASFPPGAAGQDDWVPYGESDPYADTWDGAPAFTTRVWLDRGDDPVLSRGERARLYYRTSEDAFVALFHIDTNGTVRLLFPRAPEENHFVRGGRDYRILFPGSTWWTVDDDPGVGYFFAVASPEPFDFRDFPYSAWVGGWDLSQVGRRVYSDPYVAMDEYVARLIPDWDVVPYALDFVSYHVEQRFDFPRFLCYDCHGFRPYAAWNPYYASCTTFRVVIHTDPYYYPASRYRGQRVVFARPVRPGLPRFEFKERATGESAAPLHLDRSVRSAPDVRSAPGVRVVPPSTTPRSLVPSSPRTRSRPSEVLPGREPPGTSTRPTLQRRPGSTPPVAAPPTSRSGGTAPSARPTPARGGVTPPAARPTRGGGSSPPPVPVRRSGGGGSPPPAAVPSRRGGGESGTARPSTRGGTSSARPPVRTGGSSARAPARSGGSASPPPVRRSGGGSAPPPARRGGGGAPAPLW